MTQYIDGFVFPISKDQLDIYKNSAENIANIWKEYGALSYSEFVIEDTSLPGTRSFVEVAQAKENEVVVMGWIVFESREARDIANEKVAKDVQVAEFIRPLTEQNPPIFDAQRMIYGGFQSFIAVNQ